MENQNMVVARDFNGKFRINENYRPIAMALKKKYSDLEHVPVNNILFVENTEDEKKKNNQIIYAQIAKVPTKWEEVIYQVTGKSFDFILEVYKENILHMSREQIIALIYHELRHIQVVTTKNNTKIDIVGHDIEDWAEMVEKLGLCWGAEIKGNIPDLLSDGVDWDTIEGPPTLFPKESALRIVK